LLKAKHNITFDVLKIHAPKKNSDVYGFPCNGRSYHKLWEVTRNLPIFTKAKKSKSYYCAGHYLIKFHSHWAHAFCPKLITLNRYEFQGPFMTHEDAQGYLKTLTNDKATITH
jgi:hypothetical protein